MSTDSPAIAAAAPPPPAQGPVWVVANPEYFYDHPRPGCVPEGERDRHTASYHKNLDTENDADPGFAVLATPSPWPKTHDEPYDPDLDELTDGSVFTLPFPPSSGLKADCHNVDAIEPRTVRPPDVKQPLKGRLEKDAMVLNSKTINELLHVFTFKLWALSENPLLKPSIDELESKRQKSAGATNGSLQAAEKTVSRDIVMQYPLSEGQINVLKRCWRQTRIFVADLPTHEQVLKLIALSLQVTVPFYGHCLFPNVKKIVYGEAVHLQSIDKQMKLSPSRRHPLAFACHWIVNDFNLCIHYPSISAQGKWMKDLSVSLKTRHGMTLEQANSQAIKQWYKHDSFAYIHHPQALPRLRGLHLHDVRAGLKLKSLNLGFNTVIEFGLKYPDLEYGYGGIVSDIVAAALRLVPHRHVMITIIDAERLLFDKGRLPPKGPNSGPALYKQVLQLINDEAARQSRRTPTAKVGLSTLLQGRLSIVRPDQEYPPCSICDAEYRCEEAVCKQGIDPVHDFDDWVSEVAIAKNCP